MIDVKRIETSEEYEQAFMLMCEEFPEHIDSNLNYYEWLLIAKKSNQVIGLITANKYIPKKALLCDIVVEEKHRSSGVALQLLKHMGILLMRRGFTHLVGFTPKSNKAALNTYKRVHVHQSEQIVTESDLSISVPHIEQLEERIHNIKLKRQLLKSQKPKE